MLEMNLKTLNLWYNGAKFYAERPKIFVAPQALCCLSTIFSIPYIIYHKFEKKYIKNIPRWTAQDDITSALI